MGLLERIRNGKPQTVPQGTFQATATFATPTRTVARWVELNVNPTPTFDKPRVAVKDLTRG